MMTSLQSPRPFTDCSLFILLSLATYSSLSMFCIVPFPQLSNLRLSSTCPDNNSTAFTLFLPPFSVLIIHHIYGIALPECATNFSSNSSLKIHFIHLRIKDIYLALFILELYNFIPLCFSLISEWLCYFTAVISSFLSQHLPAASFSLFTL